MIKSFQHRGLKRFFEDGNSRRLPNDMLDRIRLILARLERAKMIEVMDVHSYHLHELTGNRKAHGVSLFGRIGGLPLVFKMDTPMT